MPELQRIDRLSAMPVTDALNLFSAAMSTVLAIVALWLSVVFYRISSEQAARSTTEC